MPKIERLSAKAELGRRLEKCLHETTLQNPPSAERGGNDLNGCQDFRTENGSSQGQNLALTVLYVPSSFDSGM